MSTPLSEFTADHKTVVAAAAAAAGIADPVVFDPDDFADPLLENSVRGPLVPVDGVLIRDWDRNWRAAWPGVNYGVRVYRADGITFARGYCGLAPELTTTGFHVFVVDRRDYARLYRFAVRCKRASATGATPPVMPTGQRDVLWQNTIGFLEPANLKRLRGYGGRAKRGLLLTGPPGNGKTSACRWVRQEAERRGWEARVVGPDEYEVARRDCNPAEAVRNLFRVTGRGIVFFDDMDIALRDRDTVKETDDQAVFLAALDGLEVNEGVVYVFTTNCPVDLIDPAFRRPGRIDLTLAFPKPDTDLRRELVARWHAEIRAAVDPARVVRETDGMSFAEVEELKNLLVLRFVDGGGWDWDWAMEQFRANRSGLASRRADRPVGFIAEPVAVNGQH
ncbi:MAG TPA: ATP-binding protein [Fimbriiglobus sp.]|jgi:hypothetical protein|nr:ATP-binding protein [Fimbriiglobus sp.]